MGAEAQVGGSGGLSGLMVALVAFVVGAALRFAPGFPRQAAATLHAYVVWVALPALVLVRVPRLEVSAELSALMLLPWLLLAVAALLVVGAGRVFGWPRPVVGALLLVVPLANTSFLGLPLVEAHLGPQAVPLAIVWDQLGSFLALSTYGAFVLAAYRPPAAVGPTLVGESPQGPAGEASPEGAGGARPGLRSVGLAVLRFPPFVALVAAVLVGTLDGAGFVNEVEPVLGPIGSSLVPVVMVAIGLQWRVTLPREALGPFAFALVARLALVPLVAWGLARALGLSPHIAAVAVLEAGMGPMITAGALALEAQIAPTLTASILGWGTLLSLGTTAVWAAISAA